MKRSPVKESRHASMLESFRSEVERCVKCGACGAVCPPFLRERRESQSARGRMALVKAVLDGRLSASEVFKDRLATCTMCFACEASCPRTVPVSEIIQAAKEQARAEAGAGFLSSVVSGVLIHPAVFRAAAWLAPTVLHYSRSRKNSMEYGVRSAERATTGTVIRAKSRGRVAFFPGCAVSAFQKDIGRATLSVLHRLGYETIIPEGLHCCGRPLLSLGDRAAARTQAERNASRFEAVRADRIVTACASCGLTFKKEYSALLCLGRKTPVVLDIHEFLAQALMGISPGPVRQKVTWHEPCHLGRGQGLSGAIRGILRSIPGLTLVEMENADRCCGFGGMMRITHPKLSDGIAEAKARSIIATGASAVVTGCPGCRMQIGNALRLAGSGIAVRHTVQVLDEALAQPDPEGAGGVRFVSEQSEAMAE